MRNLWEHAGLITEHTDGRPPLAHFVGVEDLPHGHQVTASPRMACGAVIPNSVLTTTVYTDDRCVECLLALPAVEPYPTSPAIARYECPVCRDEFARVELLVYDGLVDLWECAACSSRWPDGVAGPGIRSYPEHVHPVTGLPVEQGYQEAGTVFTAPVGELTESGVLDETHTVSAYLLTAEMRVWCAGHDHPSAWSRITERRPDDLCENNVDVAVVQLACGRLSTFPRGESVRVMIDEPLPGDAPAPLIGNPSDG
jgi:hypothetical protein